MLFNLGDVLLSHRPAPAVPSGLRGLTAVFGMGTGVTPSLGSPKSWWRVAGDELRVTGFAGNEDGIYRAGYEAAAFARHSPRVTRHSVLEIHFMVKPNGLLVPVSSTHYCAYTSGLST